MNLTWWGHASATVELAGVRVLTDPLLAGRLGHLRRQVPAVADRVRGADVVVISHLHADHLHLPSLRTVHADALIVVPRGALALLRRRAPDLAERATEVSPGDVIGHAGVEIAATRAHHDGHRWPGSRLQAPALGFVLHAQGRTAWFAGDTGLFPGLDEVGPVDVALVPVGGWGPTLGPHHLDPDQAAQAVQRVGAANAVPIHYGTYWPAGLRRAAPELFRARCREPGERFAAAAQGFAAHVIAPGESVTL